jgi:tRNA1Val (adenine37-N6)-methyltransferase
MKVNTDAILLGAVAPVENAQRALDIGTGTGVIALMLAQRNEDLHIDALEPDAASFEQARYNLGNSPYSDRLNVYKSALQDFIPTTPYDVIVCNPPFFERLSQEEHNSARHSEFLPLHDLFEFADNYLKSKGLFSIIYPSASDHHILETAYFHDLFPQSHIKIKDNPSVEIKRSIWIFSKRWKRDFASKEVFLFDKKGDKSNFYQKVSRDFLSD